MESYSISYKNYKDLAYPNDHITLSYTGRNDVSKIGITRDSSNYTAAYIYDRLTKLARDA